MNKWMKSLYEYWKDKKLAEQCGLDLKDICVHQPNCLVKPEGYTQYLYKCLKCGEFYR